MGDPIRMSEFASSDGDSKLISPATFPSTVTHAPGVTYCGFTVKETGGGAAVFSIEERTAGDVLVHVLDYVNLASGESAREFYGDEGIKLAEGNSIYLNHTSGAYSGSVRYSHGIEV